MAVLADFAQGRDNNFNLLRCIAALMVIYAHSWGLSSEGEGPEPLRQLTGASLGALAVGAFFIISGYLVMQSWGRQRSLLSFCRARLFRVVPGLAGVLLFTLLLAGFFCTTLDSATFFRHPDTWKYFYKNLLLIKAEYSLPGVFVSNHYPEAVNGALWTLRYEMKMYLALAVLGLLGWLAGVRFRLFVGLFLAWYFGLTVARYWWPDPLVGAQMLKLSLCFFIGGFAARFGQYLPLRALWVLPLGALALLARGSLWYELCSALFLAYAIFCIAYLPRGPILHFNRFGDYSYGLYLYAFPIQQVLVARWPEIAPLQLFSAATVLTLVCACLSWHLIEKPALGYCKRLNAGSASKLQLARVRS